MLITNDKKKNIQLKHLFFHRNCLKIFFGIIKNQSTLKVYVFSRTTKQNIIGNYTAYLAVCKLSNFKRLDLVSSVS